MNKGQVKYWFSIVLLAIIGTLAFISILGTMTFNYEALEFKIGIQIFDHGFTEIRIPPIGSIRAKTHIAPLKLSISLENVDIKLLQGLLDTNPNKDALLKNFEQKISKIAKIYIVRLFVLAVLGGIAGSLFYDRKRLKPLWCGALVGTLIFLVFILGSIATFDLHAFQNPEYQGALEAAPWMIGLAEQAFVKLDTLSAQLELMAKNFYVLFEKIDTLDTLSDSEGTLKVLHVSDFHNNRAALQFVTQVVKSFKVDFVIDTGDFTDYGTPIEAQLLEYLQDIPVPYLFIAGNHDSPEIIKKLQQISQVEIVDGNFTNMKGLRILGLHDPASLSNNITTPDGEIIKNYQDKLVELWESEIDNPPDIVAIHNYAIGKVLAGKAPLIIHGHDHEFKIYDDQGTVVIDAGTTGAAGIRGLQATKEIPYTVALLHFQQEEDHFVLTAVDSIKVYNMQSGFILERNVVN
ncbi:MAG: metallophosphoesterase family protein [Peptococcaceae bacterium]